MPEEDGKVSVFDQINKEKKSVEENKDYHNGLRQHQNIGQIKPDSELPKLKSQGDNYSTSLRVPISSEAVAKLKNQDPNGYKNRVGSFSDHFCHF